MRKRRDWKYEERILKYKKLYNVDYYSCYRDTSQKGRKVFCIFSYFRFGTFPKQTCSEFLCAQRARFSYEELTPPILMIRKSLRTLCEPRKMCDIFWHVFISVVHKNYNRFPHHTSPLHHRPNVIPSDYFILAHFCPPICVDIYHKKHQKILEKNLPWLYMWFFCVQDWVLGESVFPVTQYSFK